MKTLIIALIGTVLTGVAVAKVHCKNFATQAQAQEFMQRNGAYYLDRDGDGEACECLPGGSKYGSSKCRRN